MFWNNFLQRIETDILPYSVRIFTALVILLAGLWAAKALRKLIVRGLTARTVEPTVRIFVGHLAYIVILMLVVIMALGRIGVQTTSLIAVMSAAVFAVALSLKDSFSSLAAGILLIVFRPFQVGDYIQCRDTSNDIFTGTVTEIQLLFTRLVMDDNRTIYIPNETLTSNGLVNFSQNPARRHDIVVSIGYEDDVKKGKQLLEIIATSDKRVLSAPAPYAVVRELTPDTVNLMLRYWTTRENFFPTQYALLEAIKIRFDMEKISLTRPQQVKHIT